MDLSIINKKDNPLLSRVELSAEVKFVNAPTPKKEDVKKKIASVEKADEKLVVIKKIGNTYGIGKINILAYIYSSEEDLKKIEPKKKDKNAKAGASKEESAEAKGE